MKNKLKAAISAAIAFIMSLSAVSVNASSSDLLYEKIQSRTLTKGVVYKGISRLYKAGWMDIYVLEIDAHDDNVGLKVLESAAELGGKHTVSDFANTYKVKAAVNADFFGSGTPMSSMGQVVRNGRMEAAQNYYNGSANKYAGFYVGNDGTPFIDYVKSSMGLYGAGDVGLEMGAKNKYTDFSKPVYFDRNAMGSTAALDSHRSDLVKIVVNEGTITDISGAGETVEIPPIESGGYVIVMNKTTAGSQLSKFHVGQRVGFSENEIFVFRPEKEISSVKLGISGGGEILRNGEAVENGLIISGRQPRTMIGVNKDKTKIYVVCVDGRGDSIGATHYEAAGIMSDLGCYDAIHFDGGGSTTMAIETETGGIEVINDPSEGSQRRVANAFGVSGVGESTGLSSLELSLENEDAIMFNGFPSAVYAKGLDNNLNATPITQQVDYNADKKGTWNGNIFTPEEEGIYTIKAAAGSASGSMKVKVLGGAASLAVNIASGGIDIGESAQLNASIINRDGFSIPADSSKIEWSVNDENIAYIKDGRLYGKAAGDVVVTAKSGAASASLNVTIGTQYASVMSFEAKRNLYASVSGEGITGSTSQTNGIAIDGNRAIALNYGFSGNKTTTQSVFCELKKPVPLPAGVRDLTCWYKGGGNGCILKAIITDANDKSYGLVFDNSLSGADWQQGRAAVPSDAAFPLQIEKLCVESLNTTDEISGTVYIDNIGAIIGGSTSSVSKEFADPLRGSLDGIGGNQVVIAAKGGLGADAYWSDTYETKELGNVSVVTLASSSGTLTANGSEQLRYLRSYLNDMSKPTVAVCLDKSLLSNTGIKDARERAAIMDILKTAVLEHNKNIIVVSTSGSGVTLKDGIRYVSLSGNQMLKIKADGNVFRYEVGQ